MRIKSVQIQKFRSINDVTITTRQILALVGANNAGKSHILRALNAFFNFEAEKAAFVNHDHMYNKQSRPKILVTFDSIKEDDEIPIEYQSNDKLVIKFTYRWDRKNPIYEIVTNNEKKTIDADTFKNLVKHFEFIYIPIIRDYKAAFSMEGGIAYKLLSQILQQQTSNRNTLQPAADRLVEKVEKSIYKPAINKITKYYPFHGNRIFNMQAHNAGLIDLIIRSVSLSLIEESQENTIDNCGSGIQSAVFLAISMAIAMSNNSNYLIGIEEPELNMHPQAQRQLIEALQDNDKYPNTQFILTTHSTVIVDRIGHECIALCRKYKGQKRDVITAVTQINDGFWSKYNMEEERYYDFFDYKNSDFFFSNYLIITESTNDCNVIKHLLEKTGTDIENSGISFIPATGERNIKYPYAIAKELGVPFICVVDRDVFQPYLNDKRELSLDENGIPKYKSERKKDSPIMSLISKEDQYSLIDNFNHSQYSECLKILNKYNIISMRYAMEIDLMVCPSFCEAMCEILGISEKDGSLHILLTRYSKAIKKYNNINNTIDVKGIKNLPKSYRCIIKTVKNMIVS